MGKSNEKDSATGEELLASSLAQSDALAKLLVAKGIVSEEDISQRMSEEAPKYRSLSQPATSPVGKVRLSEKVTAWSSTVMAAATVTLAVLTWNYASLTNKLVRLDIEPSLESGLEQPLLPSTTFLVRNTGVEPIENVVVNIRCVLYRHENDPHPTVVFAGIPGDSTRAWWRIGTLSPGQMEKKDSVEAQSMCLMNKESTEAFERSKMMSRDEPTTAPPIGYGSIVVFDITYQRQIDRKQYEVHRPFWLRKDGKTGKPGLSAPIVSSDFNRFFQELTRGSAKAK
jgi:hypothetical protein